MNPLIFFMLIFFVLGIIDRICGGHWGMATGLERGMAQMGSFAMSIVGFYCVGVSVIQSHIEDITAAASGLPFHLSLIPGIFLAPDMGGYPMAMELAGGAPIGELFALLLTSSMGCLLSFHLPLSLSAVEEEDVPYMMRGLIPGILTVPAGLLAGGVMMRVPLGELCFQMIPVLVLCVILILGFVFRPNMMIRKLTVFGKIVRGVGTLFFAVVVLGLFYEPVKVVDDVLTSDALTIVVKIIVIVCGAQILCDLLMRHAEGLLAKCSSWMKINVPAVMGLVLGLVSGAAALPLFKEMDTRGKLMNSAFGVMGAYVLGGQMAFVAGVTDGSHVAVYIVGKLIGGVAAIILAGFFVVEEK